MKEEETTPRHQEREDGLSREEEAPIWPVERKARPTQGKKPGRPRALTVREWEVAKWVSEGLTNPEIADELVIVTDTVEAHITHIQNKWAARNKAHISSLYVFEALKALRESTDEK